MPAPDTKIVYSPESALRHPVRLAREMMQELRASHRLASRLAARDLTAQYRQSLLGVLWAILLPLANTCAWLFLHRAGIVDVASTGIPYGLYVFTGTMLWSILTDALNAPLQQTLAVRSILVKVNFPREALVVAGLYQTAFHAAIKIGLVLVALIFYGHAPGAVFLLIPVAVASLMLAGTAFGLLVTPVGVLYSDVGRALPLLTQFLIFVTPVAYPVPAGGWAATIMAHNPLTPLLEFSRDSLLSTHNASLTHFLVVNSAILVTLLATWLLYRVAMPILIERMGSQP